jgi:hypothetical protein
MVPRDRELVGLLMKLLGMPRGRASRADPSAAGPFADWLEERGDPRAQEVRALYRPLRKVQPGWCVPSALPRVLAGGGWWHFVLTQTALVLDIDPCSP